MAIENYDIAVGTDDWDTVVGGVTTTGGTTLRAWYNSSVFPSSEIRAYGDIDTTAASGTILSANLYLYLHSYTVTPARGGPTKSYLVWIWKADDSGWLYIGAYTYISAGWKTIVLSAAQFAHIRQDGSKTQIRVTTGNPGTGKARFFDIRAYEYVTTDTYDMYLLVLFADKKDVAPVLPLLGAGV